MSAASVRLWTWVRRLGDVGSSQEATDLPLNGRNFMQLGLLQAGVAPVTGGLAEAGGSVSFENGVGGPLQTPVSALSWTQAYQLAGPGFSITNPYGSNTRPFDGKSFVKPATVPTVDQLARPPYAQNWNLSIEHVLRKNYLLDVRYVGNKGTRLSRFVEGEAPDLIADPNAGPHTPNQWVNPAGFLHLNPNTQAGQFANEGRNAVRGPGIAGVDLSLFKNFSIGETRRIQFRAESFNVLNHTNFQLPENDVASPDFGQILEAAPPRLFQLALKFVF